MGNRAPEGYLNSANNQAGSGHDQSVNPATVSGVSDAIECLVMRKFIPETGRSAADSAHWPPGDHEGEHVRARGRLRDEL
jgi:hypothetical protein